MNGIITFEWFADHAGHRQCVEARTYMELINQADSGNEHPVNGKYRHEIYKESMDKFMEKHGKNK